MVELTQQAREAYEDYLHKARGCVASAGIDNADEVMADLEAHIQQELSGDDGPVTLDRLREVLHRLGEPGQWVGVEDLPLWRRVLLRARISQQAVQEYIDRVSSRQQGSSTRGQSWWRKVLLVIQAEPAGWLLAYGSFAVLLLGALISGVLDHLPLMIIFVLLSFILSRAAMRRGEILDSVQRWLVYPSLVAVQALLIGLSMAWLPAVLGAAAFCLAYAGVRSGWLVVQLGEWVAECGPMTPLQHNALCAGLAAGWVALLGAGLWWIPLGLWLRLREPGEVGRALFAPVARATRWAGGTACVVLGASALLLAVAVGVAAVLGGNVVLFP